MYWHKSTDNTTTATSFASRPAFCTRSIQLIVLCLVCTFMWHVNARRHCRGYRRRHRFMFHKKFIVLSLHSAVSLSALNKLKHKLINEMLVFIHHKCNSHMPRVYWLDASVGFLVENEEFVSLFLNKKNSWFSSGNLSTIRAEPMASFATLS